MSDTQDTPLAGGSDNTALSIEAAVAQIDALEQQSVAAGAEEQTQAEIPKQPEGEQGEVAEEDVQPEALAGAEGADTPEELPVEFEKLHGNTKVILRDGTELRVGELKQRIEELQGLDRHKQEFETHKSQFQQQTAQIAHQARLLSEIAPKAMAALQAQIPPEPKPPVFTSDDALGYIEQKAAYDAAVADRQEKIAQFNQLGEWQARQQQEAVRAQQAEQNKYLQSAVEQVRQDFPETRDPATAQKFVQEIQSFGHRLGFSNQEMGELIDPRVVRLVRMGMELEKLKSEKPKAVVPRTANPAPVAKPGARGSSAERQAASREELRARVNKPGGLSMSDASALLSQL